MKTKVWRLNQNYNGGFGNKRTNGVPWYSNTPGQALPLLRRWHVRFANPFKLIWFDHYVVSLIGPFLMGLRWGHCRPAQAFIINLLNITPNLTVTLIVPGLLGYKAAKDRMRFNLTPNVESRLRIIHVIEEPKEGAALKSPAEYAAYHQILGKAFGPIYRAVIKVCVLMESRWGAFLSLSDTNRGVWIRVKR